MAKATEKDDGLRRLGGGRWQTRDERFTIESQSGTWVVVDGEQTDELGLPLVRGPFHSLGEAKAAIERARKDEPAVSPLLARATEQKQAKGPSGQAVAGPERPQEPPKPKDPRWLTDLEPADRSRARNLVERLTKLGAPDPDGIARREIAGDVPATAAYGIGRALAALGPEASPSDVARLLADGRDSDLAVSWRLVDAVGRPIVVDLGRSTTRKRDA
jgi:hypothetical protein